MRPVWPSSEYGLLPTTPNSCWSNSSNCLRNNLIQPVPIILRPSSWYHNSAIFSLDKRTVICPSDSILAGDRIYDTIFRTWAIMSFLDKEHLSPFCWKIAFYGFRVKVIVFSLSDFFFPPPSFNNKVSIQGWLTRWHEMMLVLILHSSIR